MKRIPRFRRCTVFLSVVAVISIAFLSAAPAQAYPDLWTGQAVRNQYTGNCLDADNKTWTQNGGIIQTWGCLSGDGNIQWNQIWYSFWGSHNTKIATVGAPYGPSKCLDAWANSDYPWGYRISVQDCNDGPQQRWDTDSNYHHQIRNLLYGRCLDISLNGIITHPGGGYVGLYPCRPDPVAPVDSQIWLQDDY